jgi:hypothetical protein
MKPNPTLESLVAQLPAELSVPNALDAKVLAAIQQTPQMQLSPGLSQPVGAYSSTAAQVDGKGRRMMPAWLAAAASVGLIWLGTAVYLPEQFNPASSVALSFVESSVESSVVESSVVAPSVVESPLQTDAVQSRAVSSGLEQSSSTVPPAHAVGTLLASHTTWHRLNARWLADVKPDIAVLLSAYAQLPSGFEDSALQLQQFAKTRQQLTSTLDAMATASPKVQAMLWRQLAALEQRERDYLRQLLAAS